MTPLAGTPESLVVQPGQVALGPKAVFSDNASQSVYCTIRFDGNSGDVRGILTALGAEVSAEPAAVIVSRSAPAR